MDSVMVEALVETRRVLDDLRDLAAANALRLRRDLLERAASTIELRDSPREHVVMLAKLIMETRDEAVSLHREHRVVAAALAESMD